MHQYKIEIFAYTTEGAVGALVATRYADNPEQARLICSEYDGRYMVDEDGLATEQKAYQVRLHLLCYKLCQDRAAFFAQFQA